MSVPLDALGWLRRLPHSFSPRPNVEKFAKLEGVNPSGSIKDRIARKMIEVAEKQQLIKADSILLEPTCGNTGVSLALEIALRVASTMDHSKNVSKKS